MTIQESIQTVVFQKYCNFEGRARRSEYWWFVLAYGVVSMVLGFLGKHIGLFRIVDILFALGLLLPALGVAVRRLHDIGKRGWWLLIALVPLVGAILLIVWYAQDSVPGNNMYGENPKGL